MRGVGPAGCDLWRSRVRPGVFQIADQRFHVWQTAPNSPFSGWGLGGPANSRLQMDSEPDGRLEVFALSDSTFGHLYQTAVNGDWSAWETFGSGGAEITSANNQDGREEVFASSSAGVYHKWQTGFSTWSDWVWVNSAAGPWLA